MSLTQEIIPFEGWTIRVRPGTSRRILLLLHGWTGNEDSMSVFTRNFPEKYWILSPRAPHATQPSGFSWRAPLAKNGWPTVDLFRPAIVALIDLINRWSAEYDLDGTNFDMAGFSQGGALTFTIGALHPEKIGKMGILAGFAPEGSEEVLKSDTFAGKEIFLAHGAKDERVPISMALHTIKLLENAGGSVQFCQSEVGHKLSAECLKSLERYLSN